MVLKRVLLGPYSKTHASSPVHSGHFYSGPRCEFVVSASPWEWEGGPVGRGAGGRVHTGTTGGRVGPGGGGRHGYVRSPRHSLPPNTTCTYKFTGRDGDIVWIYFLSYSPRPTPRFIMPQGSRKVSDSDSFLECTTRLQLWDGSRLIQEHCSGRPTQPSSASSGSSSSMSSSYPMSSQVSYGDALAQLRTPSGGDGASHTYGTVRTGPGQSRGGSGLLSEAAYADPGSGTYGSVRSSTGGSQSSSSSSSRHYGTINYGGRGGGLLPSLPQQPSAPQLPPMAAPPLRLCAHASLRNSTRLTRPCDTKTESYVSSGSTLAISRLTRIATALSPASFRLRYEFVDTRLPGEAMEYVGGDGSRETAAGGSGAKAGTPRRQQTGTAPGERGYGSSPLFPGAFLSGAWTPKGEKDSGPKGPGSGCHRLLRLRSTAQLPSPKNVFLYGRGGAEALSCVYRIEARTGQRIRLTMHNATFGGSGRGGLEDGPSIPTAPCVTGSDPHTGQPSCLYAPPPPVHPLAQFQPPAPRLAELRIWEVPWDDTRLPFACFCSNLTTPGSDYSPGGTSASSPASTPSPPITTPSPPTTTPSDPKGRKDEPSAAEEKDYSTGPITITSSTHVLELHFLVSKMAQWEDFNHFSFHASYVTVPSKGGGGGSSACPDRHRLRGSGGEVDLPPRRKKNEPCDGFPWLLEAQSQRSLFMMTWGTFMALRPPPPPTMTPAQQLPPGGTTASTASSSIGRCPTKNRLLVYTGQPPRLLRVICPTAPNTRHAAIHIFSEDWFLTTPSHPLLTPSTLMPTTTTLPFTTPYPPASARLLKLVLLRRHYLLDPPPPPPPPTLLLRPVIKEPSRHAFSYLQISRPRTSPLLLLRYDDPSHNTTFENLHQQHRQYQRQEGGADLQAGGCGRYRCPELDACISPTLWCDGVRNCPSGRDEAECPDRALQDLKRDHPFLGALLSLLPHSLPASIGAPAALAVVLLLAVLLTAGTACASALPCLLLWRRRRRRKGGGGGLEKKGMGGGGRRRRAPTEELLIGAPS
ncbi:uncharacterized protein [Hetaerina americana]|uniref:uncharacterized protein n=1 Tax=Hetaerina americana TaxID=62018 RepID=UPI003A7F2A9B